MLPVVNKLLAISNVQITKKLLIKTDHLKDNDERELLIEELSERVCSDSSLLQIHQDKNAVIAEFNKPIGILVLITI